MERRRHFQCYSELQMIAEVDSIGLPNAGKSSLLNAITKAAVKSCGLPLHDLEPNLGDYYGLIIADIPGLSRAHQPEKAWHKSSCATSKELIFSYIAFRRIDRPRKRLPVIRKELEQYERSLPARTRIYISDKIDMLTEKELKEKKKLLKNSTRMYWQFPSTMKKA